MANPKFTVDQMVEALTQSRGLVSITARKLHCDQQTVRNYVARHPRVKQAMEDSRETLVDSAELRLAEAVEKKGEPWAIALVLKTLGKNRGYVERVEQTGADGGPIESKLVMYLPQKDAPPDPGVPPAMDTGECPQQ